MPKCPYCGEPIRRGQDQCFACGHRLSERIFRGRRKPVNPLILVAAGVVVVAAVIGMLLLLPRHGATRQVRAEEAQLERVKDSLRRLNQSQRTDLRTDKETDRLQRELDDLESRFRRVQSQVVGEEPTAQQTKLVNRIKAEVARVRSMISSMGSASSDRHAAFGDSVRILERQIRALISDLTRAPKSR